MTMTNSDLSLTLENIKFVNDSYQFFSFNCMVDKLSEQSMCMCHVYVHIEDLPR